MGGRGVKKVQKTVHMVYGCRLSEKCWSVETWICILENLTKLETLDVGLVLHKIDFKNWLQNFELCQILLIMNMLTRPCLFTVESSS